MHMGSSGPAHQMQREWYIAPFEPPEVPSALWEQCAVEAASQGQPLVGQLYTSRNSRPRSGYHDAGKRGTSIDHEAEIHAENGDHSAGERTGRC